MPAESERGLSKASSGIAGLDEITDGGLPRGRPTLVCGSAGCGKTIFCAQFLVRGIVEHDEPGVLMSFEESTAEITANVRSLGWDLDALVADGKLAIDEVRFDATEIVGAGAFDLEALFVRLGAAIDRVGAKRVVLDTLEVLFAALPGESTVRSELRRLLRWLKDRGVTAVITAERGERTLTRNGLEEYVSDCVIVLDHRIHDQISTRRLRVLKYRGSAHSSDECPFMIDRTGFRVLPVSSLRLEHEAPRERVSTGVPRLDEMLGGLGYYRGSSILVSGSAGSGKTTLAGAFAAASAGRGERTLYLAFEESPKQLTRNLQSVGIDLASHVADGVLTISAVRPSSYGLESHLTGMLDQIERVDPRVVLIDPLSSFAGARLELTAMFSRLVDALKMRGVTALFTNLIGGDEGALGVSSIIDTWISLSAVEYNGERNRGLSILKSRGMEHSNQIREFFLTDGGIELRDVYTGSSGVLMGTARQVRETQDTATARLAADQLASKRRRLAQREAALTTQVAALREELESEVETLRFEIHAEELAAQDVERETAAMARTRGAPDQREDA